VRVVIRLSGHAWKRIAFLRGYRCCGYPSFEVKYGAQCDVDLHEFLRVQAASEVTEALRVDCSGLLNQYPDILAEELDGGMDHGSEGLGRRWGHKPR